MGGPTCTLGGGENYYIYIFLTGMANKKNHSQRDYPTEEDLKKKTASDGVDRQTDRQTNIGTQRLNRHSGPIK